MDRIAYDLKEAAGVVGLSHWTLRKLIAAGRLPTVRINRKVLIEPAALRALVERGRIPATEAR